LYFIGKKWLAFAYETDETTIYFCMNFSYEMYDKRGAIKTSFLFSKNEEKKVPLNVHCSP
jgi:hypothetical protein